MQTNKWVFKSLPSLNIMLIKNFRTQSRVMVWKRLQKEPEIVFLLLLLLLFFKCFLFFFLKERKGTLRIVISVTKTQCGITVFLTFHSPTNFSVYCPPAIITYSCQIVFLSSHLHFWYISVLIQYWLCWNIAHSWDLGIWSPVMRMLSHVQWGKGFHLFYNLTERLANQSLWTFNPRLLWGTDA